MNLQDFDKHRSRVSKLEALAARPGTIAEGKAAEAALDRIEPSWRLTDEELLAELGVKL